MQYERFLLVSNHSVGRNPRNHLTTLQFEYNQDPALSEGCVGAALRVNENIETEELQYENIHKDNNNNDDDDDDGGGGGG